MGRKKKQVLAGVVVGLCLLVAGGEFYARFGLGLGDPPLSVADDTMEYRFKPGTYHRFGNVIHYNAFSMRSREVGATRTDQQELRILVLGDSVINGGVQTSDEDLATTLLEKRLSQELKRPVFVGNVSAGSWGPPNTAAYLEKFGTFDADLILLVLSGDDGADVPTFAPIVGVSPAFPERAPVSALWEGITRYTPLSRFIGPSASSPPDPSLPAGASASTLSRVEREKVVADAIARIATIARSKNIPLGAVLYWAQYELSSQPDPSQPTIRAALSRSEIPVVDLESELRAALSADRPPIFRDEIHPTAEGQKILSDALHAAVSRALSSSTTQPTSP
ncbi:MAG TPA: SGNH/GDSL hydrolase family protein [Tepidisphaeraceae bacterium]|jgi:lysophospholipase L1-like esterase